LAHLEHGDITAAVLNCGAYRLGEMWIARTGYTGEPLGFEMFIHPNEVGQVWDRLLAVGASLGLKPCGLGARDSLRIEAGLPLYGHELAGAKNLGVGDAGFAAYVKVAKPWFIGRQAFLEQERQRQAEVMRFRFPTRVGRMAHPGDQVLNAEGEVIGQVTSCALDAEGYRLGLAHIELAYRAEGTPITIVHGDRREAAVVLPRAFKKA